MASTTPAECIQERTASGSSFMLAVAPRGRLSWIPNISGAPRLRLPPPPPPPPYDHDNKTTPGENRKRKVQQKKAARGQTATSETSGSPKAAGRAGNKRSRKERGRKMRKRRVEVVLFNCTTLVCFRFNSTLDSGRTKEGILEDF